MIKLRLLLKTSCVDSIQSSAANLELNVFATPPSYDHCPAFAPPLHLPQPFKDDMKKDDREVSQFSICILLSNFESQEKPSSTYCPHQSHSHTSAVQTSSCCFFTFLFQIPAKFRSFFILYYPPSSC